MTDEGVAEESRANLAVDPNIAELMKADPEFMAGVLRGLKDLREGRVLPWEDVRKEWGLGENS